MVLLKNDGVLPLSADKPLKVAGHRWARVGWRTDGHGLECVLPVGGYANAITVGGSGIMGVARNLLSLPRRH
jgi:beta-glucosidase